jgi:hypothetical protein
MSIEKVSILNPQNSYFSSIQNNYLNPTSELLAAKANELPDCF